ncbi:fibronectin type III domain-containing protein [Geomonas sp. Red32]|uniref:fibronectin type III domain-containing protein n=1 Tax=Geomonas sp. Red32 TaxID=2912856 RepID=UPI00202CDC4A|nr:fibronectin type III domain-containing protein [Geomonas sp. Red32]MCM0082965.1 fibronectin type III domain-containing protein [Geomonas sp. Red32]
MNAATRFLMNHKEMDPSELVLWLEDAATLQENHGTISKEKDDWVPGSVQFRHHKEAITRELDRAASLNVPTTKELEEAHAAAVSDILVNAEFIVLKGGYQKDESWFHNNGYISKDKLKRNYNKLVSSTATQPKAKNGPEIGEVTLGWERDEAAGSYLLQICKGIPVGDESYADQGYYKKVRVVVSNLERASWYYFRVRSIGHNEVGPWSEPVGIIVT